MGLKVSVWLFMEKIKSRDSLRNKCASSLWSCSVLSFEATVSVQKRPRYEKTEFNSLCWLPWQPSVPRNVAFSQGELWQITRKEQIVLIHHLLKNLLSNLIVSSFQFPLICFIFYMNKFQIHRAIHPDWASVCFSQSQSQGLGDVQLRFWLSFQMD